MNNVKSVKASYGLFYYVREVKMNLKCGWQLKYKKCFFSIKKVMRNNYQTVNQDEISIAVFAKMPTTIMFLRESFSPIKA